MDIQLIQRGIILKLRSDLKVFSETDFLHNAYKWLGISTNRSSREVNSYQEGFVESKMYIQYNWQKSKFDGQNKEEKIIEKDIES